MGRLVTYVCNCCGCVRETPELPSAWVKKGAVTLCPECFGQAREFDTRIVRPSETEIRIAPLKRDENSCILELKAFLDAADVADLRSALEKYDNEEDIPARLEPVEGYVWCDVHCCVHEEGNNPYGYSSQEDYCDHQSSKPHRRLWMQRIE